MLRVDLPSEDNVDEVPQAYLENAERLEILQPAFGVILEDPKYPRNVATVQRTCSCYGCGHLWITGKRVSLTPYDGYRLPREERMRGYKDVELKQLDFKMSQLPSHVVPVAIELVPGSENLTEFEHPENALYVFGPEDGSISKGMRSACHRFVKIPSRHCFNLATAATIVLYDRYNKMR